MFMVLLKFSDNKSLASENMQGHNLWIKQGFDDGVFLMAGSLQPGLGGTVMVNGESREELKARVQKDPFVEHNVVSAEILEIDPKNVDARLNFLNEPRN